MQKIIPIFIIVVVVLGIFFVGDNVLTAQPHNGSPTVSKPTQKTVAAAQQPNNPLSLYPKASIDCSSTASWIESSVDYTVEDMHCTAPNVTANRFLSCNGTIMQHATNVSLDCYRSEHYATADQLQCDGTANGDADPTNLSLNYTCVLPGMTSNTTLYSCSGDISDYSSFAVSLPITVSCNGA